MHTISVPQLCLVGSSCFHQVSYAGGLLGIAVLCVVQSWLSVVGPAIHMHAASPAAGQLAYTFQVNQLRHDAPQANKPEFHQLDIDKFLRQQLSGKAVIEFPVLIVLLPEEEGNYSIMQDAADVQDTDAKEAPVSITL